MKATLHLTNGSSTRLHGPGRKLSIMAAPRSWEHHDGTVQDLVPRLHSLRAHQAGTLSLEKYRAEYEAGLHQHLIAGSLQPHVRLQYRPTARLIAASVAAHEANLATFAVDDGDTLCCCCSVADARDGLCHRTWLAPVLKAAGWRVVLDGIDLDAAKDD